VGWHRQKHRLRENVVPKRIQESGAQGRGLLVVCFGYVTVGCTEKTHKEKERKKDIIGSSDGK
jgi:hypothetical protein